MWFVESFALKSQGILHYFWSADLSKSFSQLIVSIFTFFNQWFLPIFIFSQYFSNRFCPVEKVWVYSTLLISWFINFKDWFCNMDLRKSETATKSVTLLSKRLRQRCFLVNSAKFPRSPFRRIPPGESSVNECFKMVGKS